MMILLAYARGNVAFLTILIGEGPWDIVCREAWKLIPEGGARAYRILEGPNGRKVQRGENLEMAVLCIIACTFCPLS